MTLVDVVALAAALRLEERMGAKVALSVYRALSTRLATPEARGRAALGALRCATHLADEVELARLTVTWEGCVGEHASAARALVRALADRGLEDLAARLATAEAVRAPSVRSFYVRARCLERRAPMVALGAWSAVVARAALERGSVAEVLGDLARRRWLALALEDSSDEAPGPNELGAATPEVEPTTRLVLARRGLRATSHYARASALSTLADLARVPMSATPDAVVTMLAEAAIRLAARHVDRRGDSLSAVEEERALATLSHWRDPVARAAATARVQALRAVRSADGVSRDAAALTAAALDPALLPLVERARALVSGGIQPSEPPAATSEHELASVAMDLVGRIASEQDEAAALLLVRAARLVPMAPAPPASLFLVIELALARPLLHEAAAALAEAMLSVHGPPPARGYLRLGLLSWQAKQHELALRALAAAVRAREPNASSWLVELQREDGWRLAERGDRDAAIHALQETKRGS